MFTKERVVVWWHSRDLSGGELSGGCLWVTFPYQPEVLLEFKQRFEVRQFDEDPTTTYFHDPDANILNRIKAAAGHEVFDSLVDPESEIEFRSRPVWVIPASKQAELYELVQRHWRCSGKHRMSTPAGGGYEERGYTFVVEHLPGSTVLESGPGPNDRRWYNIVSGAPCIPQLEYERGDDDPQIFIDSSEADGAHAVLLRRTLSHQIEMHVLRNQFPHTANIDAKDVGAWWDGLSRSEQNDALSKELDEAAKYKMRKWAKDGNVFVAKGISAVGICKPLAVRAVPLRSGGAVLAVHFPRAVMNEKKQWLKNRPSYARCHRWLTTAFRHFNLDLVHAYPGQCSGGPIEVGGKIIFRYRTLECSHQVSELGWELSGSAAKYSDFTLEGFHQESVVAFRVRGSYAHEYKSSRLRYPDWDRERVAMTQLLEEFGAWLEIEMTIGEA